jgi:hypothetical protein
MVFEHMTLRIPWNADGPILDSQLLMTPGIQNSEYRAECIPRDPTIYDKRDDVVSAYRSLRGPSGIRSTPRSGVLHALKRT